ncbi:MAG: GNAT family N-acetyltransferase [Chloroflexi bacterium]|nr:GNAT family N-acetyltransferase [Chloroflexota bacterium]
MEFTLHTSFETLAPLAREWDDLLHETITDAPFLRFQYLRDWHQTLGGGEWPQALLAAVTAHEDGRLVGVAPLFQTPNREGEPALMLLGSIEISDYLDLIVRPTDLTRFLNGLLDFLASSLPDGWRVLDWVNLPEASPTLPALESESARRGWTFVRETYQPAPYIPLPADFETYLASIDKKQRHEIRRKMRRASEHEIPVRMRLVDDESTLDAEMDGFFELMKQDPAKEKFLTEAMRAQMLATAHTALRGGWLWLAFLEVGGRKAAGAFNFDYGNRLWGYNSGVNREFIELSPGWVLLGHTLQWACEHGRSEFDFMRGNEEYKYRFGGRDRLVMRVKVTR